MKGHIEAALASFDNGCNRAAALKSIFDYLRQTAPRALNCDDILRSALVLIVSSFDLLLHDLYLGEVSHRFVALKEVGSLRLPFNIIVSEERSRLDLVRESIKRDHSYRSFVAPDKLAECLKALISSPWEIIATNYGQKENVLKARLKGVVDLRNRIAHEADVNPAYGGIELWPIYSEDVISAIEFLRKLGIAISKALDSHSPL